MTSPILEVRRLDRTTLERGVRALAGTDAHLAGVLQRIGTPPLWARRPGFATLVQIILEQQVSLPAARTLYRRLEAELGGVDPQRVLGMQESGLRAFGMTRQKARYCHGLAARILDGRLDLARAARAEDAQGRGMLLDVPGLGPWSVDIYYLMALRRPDVWPQGDLALAIAIREVKRLRSTPTRERQHALARRWAPWRSVAARILWSHYLEARGQYTAQPGRFPR
jgi:DNA-3-methyladenine glycosylase II